MRTLAPSFRILTLNFMRNWRDYMRAGEALFLLVVFGFAQRFIPMAWWSVCLGCNARVPKHWQGVKPVITMQRLSVIEERAIAIAIKRACRRLPFKPTCLVQASAGQVMLRLRRRSGVVIIGLRLDPIAIGKRWEAHAWLIGEWGAITGGENAHEFTPTNVFEVPFGLSADEIHFSKND